jgi:hypothetical protein
MASAFLATLLRHHEDFRSFFLSQLQSDDPVCLARKKWELKVEKDGVDVWMAADAGPVVIIENKLFPSAVKAGQLLGYYEKEIKKIDPDRKLIAVYLAPGPTIGNSEVERVLDSERFRQREETPGDRAVRVSWQEVAIFQPAAGDHDQVFITSGFENILKAIDSRRDTVFPPVGDRKTIGEIMQQARSILASDVSKVHLRPWRARENEELYTVGTKATVYLRFNFEAQETEPYAPIGVLRPDGRLAVKLCTHIQLSGLGRKDGSLRGKWKDFLDAKRIDVPGLGTHELEGDRWFLRSESLTERAETLVQRVVAAGKAIFARLDGYL